MGTLDRKIGSKQSQYTRIEILAPTEYDDGYQTKTRHEVFLSNVPAFFVDPQNNEEEDLVGNAIRSRTVAEFEMRSPYGKDIKPTWKLRDVFENKQYEVISSPVTVGRFRFVRFKAALIE